jgi:hypothetical protein
MIIAMSKFDDKRFEYSSQICQYLGFACLIPLGNVALKVCLRENNMKIFLNYYLLISFILGALLLYFGYKIVLPKYKKETKNVRRARK